MASQGIDFFSAVLILSDHPERLAKFYRDVLGLPLREESHDDSELHYGCELGDVHFAIHPARNFGETRAPTGNRVRLAFAVFDIKSFIARLRGHGVKPDYAPRVVGFAVMTAVTDPDGNSVEVTQLSESWMSHLRRNRDTGKDILVQWEALK